MAVMRSIGPVGRPNYLLWLTVAAALVIGIASLRYALPGMPLAPPLPNAALQPELLVLHAVASAMALMLGAGQFLLPRRGRTLVLHRCGGRLYVLAVLLGGASGLGLAGTSATGAVAAGGFGLLAVFWLGVTGLAFVAVVQRRMEAHRRWMLRSMALTGAAITLRLYLPAANLLDLPFELSYPAIAWLCWVPNLLAVEWRLRRATVAPAPRIRPSAG